MDAKEVVDRTDDMSIIDSFLAFNLKQFPDSLIKKFKAGCCARDDEQLEGIYFLKPFRNF